MDDFENSRYIRLILLYSTSLNTMSKSTSIYLFLVSIQLVTNQIILSYSRTEARNLISLHKATLFPLCIKYIQLFVPRYLPERAFKIVPFGDA